MRQNGVRSDVRFPYGSRDKKSTGGNLKVTMQGWMNH